MPRSIVKLKVYLPVLPGLCPVLAVAGRFVRFIIYFCAESMGKLFCAAPSLFAKEVLFAEVFTKVFIITGKRKEAELQQICWESTIVTNGIWLLLQDEVKTSLGGWFFLYPQASFPAETTCVQSTQTLTCDPRC